MLSCHLMLNLTNWAFKEPKIKFMWQLKAQILHRKYGGERVDKMQIKDI